MVACDGRLLMFPIYTRSVGRAMDPKFVPANVAVTARMQEARRQMYSTRVSPWSARGGMESALSPGAAGIVTRLASRDGVSSLVRPQNAPSKLQEQSYGKLLRIFFAELS